jgi:hypothetical protein
MTRLAGGDRSGYADYATDPPNGAAMAALLASGIGAFAIGLFVVLAESGAFSAPVLYAPAGGVSGRTTLAAISWLVSWAVLHGRWRAREIDGPRVLALTLVLVALGVIATFPPVWQMF